MCWLLWCIFFQSDAWKKVSSMNNLADVYKLHCDVKTLEKGMRDIFVSGCMEDVRKQFQVGKHCDRRTALHCLFVCVF